MDISLKEAFRIAVEVHGDQKDKAGEPYLFHIMRVAAAMNTDEERVIAILHDAIEDTLGKLMSEDGSYLPTPKCRVLHRIRDAYGDDVTQTVMALTRSESEPYMDYIRRLSTSPLAVKVKFADLKDNRNRDRLRKLPCVEADRLFDKYEQAWLVLYSAADDAGTLPEVKL